MENFIDTMKLFSVILAVNGKIIEANIQANVFYNHINYYNRKDFIKLF